MKVILLKDVQKVGRKHDIKTVADGFAMNSLIPRGLAQVATKDAIERVEKLKKEEEVQRAIMEDLLMKNLKQVGEAKVSVSGKASAAGHLFAGIHRDDLSKMLKEQAHLDIPADLIVLEKPIKEIGEHKIAVKIKDKEVEFTLEIKSEE